MVSRYESDIPIREGKILRSATAVDKIRRSQRQGAFATRERVLRQGERLDHIAGEVFGNATLWWVIAATSNIGWAMQVPPGTILKIPVNLNDVLELI